MNQIKFRKMVYGGLLAAVIALLTAFIKLPVPVTNGYIHIGDGAIFLAAALLGPYAAIPAAVGSALADMIGGYYIYMLPTAIIKGVMGLIAGRFIGRQTISIRNILIFVLCEVVMVAGYFVFEWAMYGIAAAIGAVVPNLIQGAAGVVLGCVFAGACNRLSRNSAAIRSVLNESAK